MHVIEEMSDFELAIRRTRYSLAFLSDPSSLISSHSFISFLPCKNFYQTFTMKITIILGLAALAVAVPVAQRGGRGSYSPVPRP